MRDITRIIARDMYRRMNHFDIFESQDQSTQEMYLGAAREIVELIEGAGFRIVEGEDGTSGDSQGETEKDK